MSRLYKGAAGILTVAAIFAAGSAMAEDASAKSAAEETSSQVEKSGDTLKITSEGRPHVSAATIDFAGELELPSISLVTLGSRIEVARLNADPVGLANVARELAAAEEASGKKAELTAEAVMQEAIELAKTRNNSAELKVVAVIAKGSEGADELMQLAQKAAEQEKQQQAAAESGERSRGIFHELVVDNETHEHLHIYYNGREVGTIRPHGHAHFHVHDHQHYFDLIARGHWGFWKHKHVHGNYNNYYWTIHDHGGHRRGGHGH